LQAVRYVAAGLCLPFDQPLDAEDEVAVAELGHKTAVFAGVAGAATRAPGD